MSTRRTLRRIQAASGVSCVHAILQLPICAAFWMDIEKQKEENIRKLESLIRGCMIELDVKSSDTSTNPKL